MARFLTHDLIVHLIFFQAILVFIALGNVRALRRAAGHPAGARLPKVSILVPARNEQANIERCVRSLLSQDYPDFEVLVLDDASTDRTRAILRTLAQADSRLVVLDGRPLAAGWLGKNWACAQLASRATGEMLYFTDADTFHRPGALRAAVSAIEGEQAGLVSGFPRQEVPTWGEKLTVPFFSWVMLSFLPLPLAYRLNRRALSCAVGQMMLFRRTAYDAIGGHASVRASIVDDLALARRITAMGYGARMMSAVDLVSCRMYRSGREAWAGFAKNLFAAFDFRLVPYLAAWLWLAVMFLVPLADLALYGLGLAPDVSLGTTLVCIGVALMLWLIPYRELRVPAYVAALYPATTLVMTALALWSLLTSLGNGLTWKGRALRRPRPKLW